MRAVLHSWKFRANKSPWELFRAPVLTCAPARKITIVKQGLALVQAEDSIPALEEKIGMGQTEEVIEQASGLTITGHSEIADLSSLTEVVSDGILGGLVGDNSDVNGEAVELNTHSHSGHYNNPNRMSWEDLGKFAVFLMLWATFLVVEGVAASNRRATAESSVYLGVSHSRTAWCAMRPLAGGVPAADQLIVDR
ncbi:hypothetical protein Y032_0050g1962 [Ancylostoma ceylanicum]|uniref:Uncharacterized protein n=1 Tax=Ancylostoma ceylanicum TaxID=53326 RepID=A0A016U8U4_9BILA|nr:hypothetical protein Y032_0050g1962 [Ancylostoma ceylanicum]